VVSNSKIFCKNLRAKIVGIEDSLVGKDPNVKKRVMEGHESKDEKKDGSTKKGGHN